MFIFSRNFLVLAATFGAALLLSSGADAQTAINTVVETDNSFNEMFERAAISFGGFSAIASAAAYILGTILAISAILKFKDLIDNPAQIPLRDPFIRLIIGGALFALPTVMNLLAATFGGQTGDVETGMMVVDTGNLVGNVVCEVAGGGGGIGGAIFGALTGGTLSSMICAIGASFAGLTGIINVILYLAGIILTIWGLIQLKDHVVDPRSMPLPVPLKKIMVAGIFFAFPAFITVVYNTFAGDNVLVGTDLLAVIGNIFNWLQGGQAPGTCGGAGGILGNAGAGLGNILGQIGGVLGIGGGAAANVGGLDCMFIRLISDISGPIQAVTSLFCYLAGIILIILAVRRIMESTDKGPRGPLGTGTFAMLALGGVLLSFNTFLATVSGSLFPSLLGALGVGGQALQQSAMLTYAPGLGQAGVSSFNSVLSSVMAFSFLLGMLSILRGGFILKDVADGGNASIMAGMTHIIGGGMAVNLGPLITAVQNTLGLQSVGLAFG